MSAKSDLYNELKAAGVALPKSYPQLSVAELWDVKRAAIRAGQLATPAAPLPPPADAPTPPPAGERLQDDREDRAGGAERHSRPKQAPPAPQQNRPKDEHAGLQQNRPEDEIIRVDENGLRWLQDEVRKPAFPRARGRRVLRQNDPGVRKIDVPSGEYTETVEVAGDRLRPSEVKITLPSYQVGLYIDPRYPFRVHIYNEQRGFNLEDVEQFYGGRELVPGEIKRIYVENVLCYDMRTTVRAITAEHRQLLLTQGRK